MKIKLTTPETKLISFWDIYGKELEVKDTKTVQFASGPKKYYIAEFEGKDYEVPEDMVDNSIPNNYEGKSPEQVWNAWTQDQRTHFIKDHFDEINRAGNSEGIQYTTWISASNLLEKQSYGELSRPVKQILQNHITSGQYKFGGKVEESELDEINSLLGMTVEVWPLGSNEPIVYTIKGIHVTPPQFDKRFVALSFYGDEWPSQFNDHDVIPLEKLGDFLAGEEIKLYDSNNEPYMINIGGIAAKGKKVDGYYIGVFEPDGKMNMAFKLVDLKDTAMDKIIDYALQNNYTVKKITEQEYNNSPSYFDRESGKFKAAKGTKINEMKNNYYYLKIGNIIHDKVAGTKFKITGFNSTDVLMTPYGALTSGGKETFVLFDHLIMVMNSNDVNIEGTTYETDRDKLLLKMEIDNIQNSFKEVEFKEKAEKLLTETSQVKKEANDLLSKLESKTKGFEDTVAGMEAIITTKNPKDVWQDGKIGDYKWNAKVYDEPSGYGINNGRVSKLSVYDRSGKLVLNYDRGWDIKPKTKHFEKVLNEILWLFPSSDEKSSKGTKVDGEFYIGEVVQVTKGHYKGKNGTISDLDADKNHVEVTMGDEMVRFLELADIKKIESGSKPTKMVSNANASKKEWSCVFTNKESNERTVIAVIAKNKKDAEREGWISSGFLSKEWDMISLYPIAKKGNKVEELELEKYAIEYLTGDKITKHHAESNNYMYQKEGKTKWFSIPSSEVHNAIEKHGEALAIEKGKTTKASNGTKVKSKKKGANPKRGKTTLSERNYMKKFKKEFEALKDAYPDSTFKQLIEKHKKTTK